MKAEWTNKDSLTSGETTKAILVIDVPMLYDGRHLCNECPIWNNEHCFCQYDFNMKTKGCPLRPLPQFMDEAVPYQVSETEVDCYQDPYATGFNDSIRLITGETE